jgi:hypothetical protein
MEGVVVVVVVGRTSLASQAVLPVPPSPATITLY